MKNDSSGGAKNRLLIIEDDANFAEALKLKIQEEAVPVEVEITDFSIGLDQLKCILPDIIILDIFQGLPQLDKKEGIPIWNAVWGQFFCPLVFVSASRVDEFVRIANRHPFIEYVVKTEPDAIGLIMEKIKRLLPLSSQIKQIRDNLALDLTSATQKALTEAVLQIGKGKLIDKEVLSLIRNTSRRRLACLMRMRAEEERERIFAWEQYIYPAMAPYLMMGDILKSTTGQTTDPAAFRVVLTPSCDLAQKKVDAVLVAKCVPIGDYWTRCNLPMQKERAKERAPRNLSEPQTAGLSPLPSYGDLIPNMAVSLRDLELLMIKDSDGASSKDVEYRRIASIDSPFREYLAWAYFQIAGRPGMPERLLDVWVDEILVALSKD